jgi:hypothetical protein
LGTAMAQLAEFHGGHVVKKVNPRSEIPSIVSSHPKLTI